MLVGNENRPFPCRSSRVARNGSSTPSRPGGALVSSHRRERTGCHRNLVAATWMPRMNTRSSRRSGYEGQRSTPSASSALPESRMAWPGAKPMVPGRPIGEGIAGAIEQGYTSGSDPYHGYFFKILKDKARPLRSAKWTCAPRRHDRRLCAGRGAGRIQGDRRANLHGQPRRRGLRKGPSSKTLDEFKKMERFESRSILDADLEGNRLKPGGASSTRFSRSG